MALPSHANVVIVGGGVAGCSIAYHLTRIGITDVVLLERKQLTCGTTWHAAGLVGQLRATRNLTELAKYTADLYHSLEAETGQATGLQAERLDQRREDRGAARGTARGVSMGKTFGLRDRRAHARRDHASAGRCSRSTTSSAAFSCPRTGRPIRSTRRRHWPRAPGSAARAFSRTPASSASVVENGRAVGVETDAGYIAADTVVLCAGMWSHRIAADIDVAVPLHAAEHFYIVTEPIAGLPGNLPVLRVQDECAYYKEDAGKLLMGCFEPVAKPWGMQRHSRRLLLRHAARGSRSLRADPRCRGAGACPCWAARASQLFFNGPESFTPDDRYYIGETPEVRDLFVATGFNSVGIAASGGAGKVVARLDSRPSPADGSRATSTSGA